MAYEGATVEYKEMLTPDVKKTIVAFANTEGGTLYVGVTDDGTPIGVDDPDDVVLKLTNMARDSIRPDVTMFAKATVDESEGVPIVVLHVQKGTSAPYYIAGKGIRPEGVYVRQGASSVPATESAILRMIKETDGESYEEVRSLNQELTFDAIGRAFAQAELPFSEAQMRTLGLLRGDGVYTNLALLLSDQNPHTTKAAVFEGGAKTTFKDRREFTGSLLEQLDDAAAFIDRYNSTRSRIEGLRRVDERDYPPEAIREALLNAVVHRDYAFGGPALVSIFSDRMELVTLGGLTKGITLSDLELGVSIARNRGLANVFYRLGLVEAYGTGVPKIRECYAGSPLDAKIDVSDNAFKITLPKLPAPADDGGRSSLAGLSLLTEREKAAISIFGRKSYVRRRDLEEEFSLSIASANRIIKALEEKGCIEQVGKGRSTRYRLKEQGN